jgi:uncharacterized membrane protein
MTTWAIILLSGIGLYISAYFTLVYYGALMPSTSLMPSFCRMGEQSCLSVIQTPYARVFKLPNFVLGIIYYAGLIILSGTGLLTSPVLILRVMTAISWLTVGLGVYLVYALIYRVKVPCPLCYASHIINLALAILLTLIATS